MITFILNDTEVNSPAPPGMPLLEVIRREQKLKGTKLVCAEGECGACTVLVGTLSSTGVTYQAVTSCIVPIANFSGKHVVTIEGIRTEIPGPVQQAMITCNGTQCGFCTPGFVISLTGKLLGQTDVDLPGLVEAMDGNICRCTGYKSIERAAEKIAIQFAKQTITLNALIEAHVIPKYFSSIASRLRQLEASVDELSINKGVHIGGGTDLYVQRPHEMRKSALQPTMLKSTLHGVSVTENNCVIGAAETMSTLQQSSVLRDIIPGIQTFLAPVGSTQIRNMATVGGNLVNASPIGDLTIMLLGLNADIILFNGISRRRLKLSEFYQGYKKLAKEETEVIEQIQFNVPMDGAKFHFERVCKRTFLDVASVNSACLLRCDDLGTVQEAYISAGGVAPIPLLLKKTAEWLRGKMITSENILKAAEVIQEEISPISDIRGSEEYKRRLLCHLFFIHVSTHFPDAISIKELITT